MKNLITSSIGCIGLLFTTHTFAQTSNIHHNIPYRASAPISSSSMVPGVGFDPIYQIHIYNDSNFDMRIQFVDHAMSPMYYCDNQSQCFNAPVGNQITEYIGQGYNEINLTSVWSPQSGAYVPYDGTSGYQVSAQIDGQWVEVCYANLLVSVATPQKLIFTKDKISRNTNAPSYMSCGMSHITQGSYQGPQSEFAEKKYFKNGEDLKNFVPATFQLRFNG